MIKFVRGIAEGGAVDVTQYMFPLNNWRRLEELKEELKSEAGGREDEKCGSVLLEASGRTTCAGRVDAELGMSLASLKDCSEADPKHLHRRHEIGRLLLIILASNLTKEGYLDGSEERDGEAAGLRSGGSVCGWVYSSLVLTVALLVYCNALSCSFVFDDISAIKENRDLRPHTPVTNLFFHDFWGTPMQKVG
ncbi:hypothetical protein O3P69_004563 [Scylla paramamosain]|uniref:Uncharacterized protein n=1 Tax=Scylla paramamosain TaxID=85552 RepID=A0AAW0UE22_SCYPA